MVDLENIERIKQLKGRYFRKLDICDINALKEIFIDDATVEFQSPTYEFYLEGWDELEPFFRDHFTETRFGLHHGHQPEITVNGDQATGIWYLHDMFINLEDETKLEGSAIYDDTLVRQDNQWYIESIEYTRRFEKTAPLDDEAEIAERPISK